MKKNNHNTLIILGIVPFLAATARLYYALWLSVVFVMVTLLTALTASLTRTLIAGKVRLILDAAVTAGLTTAAVLILRACVPAAEAGMGICLSLLAVNWLVLSNCETSAENDMKASVKNALFSGLAGAGLLILTASVRELLTYGTLFRGFGGSDGVRIFSDWFSNVGFAGTSAGALVIFGLVSALMQKISKKIRVSRRERAIRYEAIAGGQHPDLILDRETGKIVRRTTAELLEKRRHVYETSAEYEGMSDETNAENDAADAEGTAATVENETGEVEE